MYKVFQNSIFSLSLYILNSLNLYFYYVLGLTCLTAIYCTEYFWIFFQATNRQICLYELFPSTFYIEGSYEFNHFPDNDVQFSFIM